MKKLVLEWLFGTDNIKDYIVLLRENMDYCNRLIEANNQIIDANKSHLKTLEEERENIDIIRKLIKVCENHGIDVDKEIKHIEL